MDNQDDPEIEGFSRSATTLYEHDDIRTPQDKDASEEAHLFLEQEGPKIHPIFSSTDTETSHTESLSKFQKERRIESHTEQFLVLVKTDQDAIREPQLRSFDLNAKYSWDQVLRSAKQAEATYVQAGGKIVRKGGRRFTANAEAAQPWLRLIPNNFWTSTLSGGLRLVFEAATRIAQRREDVLGQFLRIPDVVAEAESCLDHFPDDQVLSERAEKVYVAALTAIEESVEWLQQKPIVKPLRALVTGTLYDKPFKEKKRALEEALDALQKRVSTLQIGVDVDNKKTLEALERTTSRIEVSGAALDATTKTTQHRVETLHSGLQDLSLATNAAGIRLGSIEDGVLAVQKSQEDTQNKIDDAQTLNQAREDAKKAMQLMLEEKIKNSEWRKRKDKVIRRLQKEMASLQKAASFLTNDDLLDILDASPGLANHDLKKILRACDSNDLSAFHMAQKMIENDALTHWLSADDSVPLLMEGGSLMMNSSRIVSPSSLMSSLLIKSHLDKEPALPVYFFCGLHTSPRDPFRGPRGLIRSLICQILRHFVLELDFIASRRYRDQLECFNIHTLCDCFGKLVKRLPAETVLVCVVDGVAFFERTEWADDIQTIVGELQGLVEDSEVIIVFKFLVTSATRTRYTGNLFAPQHHVILPPIAEDGRGAASGRQRSWNANRRPPKATQKHSYPNVRKQIFSGNWSDESKDDAPSESESDGWGVHEDK